MMLSTILLIVYFSVVVLSSALIWALWPRNRDVPMEAIIQVVATVIFWPMTLTMALFFPGHDDDPR